MQPGSQTDVVADDARVRTMLLPSVKVTPEARRYAVKELARRAGVPRDFFREWRIEVGRDQTTVFLGSETNHKILFPHTSDSLLSEFIAGNIPMSRAQWFHSPDDSRVSSDLLLPFCDLGLDSAQPLYTKISEGSVACRADLLVCFLFTLSRLEETVSAVRDEHGRFPASASLAVRHNFLDRPILDEHGRAFEQVLSSLLPAWRPEPRSMRLKLTHDIDDVGIPFEFRTSLGHALKRKRPLATARDAVALLSLAKPAELALVEELAAISKARGLHSAFFWKASPHGPRDSGYDPSRGKIKQVITHLKQEGFELGVHPGYNTFRDRGELVSEVAILRSALGESGLGGRQHYLRWSPETWLDWEACGLSYDSSLGFADQFGFRAGTSFPYRPWSLSENRELNLIEVPLILMDCTPVKYMRLEKQEGLRQIEALIGRTAQVGGVFTLLWHNTPLMDPEYDGWYEAILDLLCDVPSYDMPGSSEDLW
jgi:hypothetical protein